MTDEHDVDEVIIFKKPIRPYVFTPLSYNPLSPTASALPQVDHMTEVKEVVLVNVSSYQLPIGISELKFVFACGIRY